MLFRKFPFSRLQEMRRSRCFRTYPGRTGKHSLALDEWIEICNRDYSLLPSVRTLVGFIRQGLHVGVAKKCKRFVECFYGPGDVDERTVNASGTGSKGNCIPEKKRIYEICCLLLNGSRSRKIAMDSVSRFEGKLKTKLDRRAISDQTSGVDDSTTRLLNGVSHVYRSTGAGVNRATGPCVADADENDKELLENMIAEQVVQRFDDAERTMNDIVSREENVEEEAQEHAEEEERRIKGDTNKVHKYCTANIWVDGWAKIKEMDMRAVRLASENRLRMKQKVTKYILSQVNAMKRDIAAVVILKDQQNAAPAPWAAYVKSL